MARVEGSPELLVTEKQADFETHKTKTEHNMKNKTK